MSTKALSHPVWYWILGAATAGALWIISASVAAAGDKIVVHDATQTFQQTEISPSDAPVRMAVFTSADRDQLKVEPARWWGGWGWGYPARYYSYYPGYYGYYGAPYYTYYSAPYATPYYTYYAPPTYYAATPYYSYYAPYYSYSGPAVTYWRAPRRAFYGSWYW